MNLITRNALRHVYDALQARERLADSENISNLKLFYSGLISEYCSSEKSGQCFIAPLTGQDVENFYAQTMSNEDFVDLINTKMIAQLAHFDPSMLHKLCWECFSGQPAESQCARMLAIINKQSALLLWLIFCKLDTDGKLKLHSKDITAVIIRLLMHLKVATDQITVKKWLSNQRIDSTDWINFWQFFMVTTEKCLIPNDTQIGIDGVKMLYDEIVDEVIKTGYLEKKGHVRHTWKKRWFILTSTDLTYYETKDSELFIKKGTLMLNPLISVEVMAKDDSQHSNRFKYVDGNYICEISADNPIQMNDWIKAINLAVKLYTVKGRNYLHKLLIALGNDTADDVHPLQTLELSTVDSNTSDQIAEQAEKFISSKTVITAKRSLTEPTTERLVHVQRSKTVHGDNITDSPQHLVITTANEVTKITQEAEVAADHNVAISDQNSLKKVTDEECIPQLAQDRSSPKQSASRVKNHSYETIDDELFHKTRPAIRKQISGATEVNGNVTTNRPPVTTWNNPRKLFHDYESIDDDTTFTTYTTEQPTAGRVVNIQRPKTVHGTNITQQSVTSSHRYVSDSSATAYEVKENTLKAKLAVTHDTGINEQNKVSNNVTGNKPLLRTWNDPKEASQKYQSIDDESNFTPYVTKQVVGVESGLPRSDSLVITARPVIRDASQEQPSSSPGPCNESAIVSDKINKNVTSFHDYESIDNDDDTNSTPFITKQAKGIVGSDWTIGDKDHDYDTVDDDDKEDIMPSKKYLYDTVDDDDKEDIMPSKKYLSVREKIPSSLQVNSNRYVTISEVRKSKVNSSGLTSDQYFFDKQNEITIDTNQQRNTRRQDEYNDQVIYASITPLPLSGDQVKQLVTDDKASDLQLSGKQLQEIVKRLCSLEQSIKQLQAELSVEQQKTQSLNSRCETLESSLAAEKEVSLVLQAKCVSQEERLRTMEDTVEQLWTISRDEIDLSNETLGEGGWGYVKEATFRGRRVAAKFLHERIRSPHNQKLFAKEIKIFARCHHKNLVEFIGAVLDHPAIIVVELMNCNLRSALVDGTTTKNHTHSICIDVAQGLVYLHSIQPHPVIHRDVSAPNVLLKAADTGWIAKLSDLGSAQFLNKASSLAPGCVLYAAPEVKYDDTAFKQTEKIDVYSYGVLLIEILSKKIPNGTVSELINSLPSTRCIPLIRDCTNADPAKRPTMKEIITCLNKMTV